MSNYYCLVAGLPEVALEDGKLTYTVGSFKEELYDTLSAADRAVIDLYYLQFDNANLLALLKDKEAAIDPRGCFTAEELLTLIAEATQDDTLTLAAPSYLYHFVQAYHQAQEEGSELIEDKLSAYYYAFAAKQTNAFTRQWFAFCQTVNNILAALTARKYGLEVAQYIVGDCDHCEAIRTSGARDFGLSSEITYMEQLQLLHEVSNLAEKERKLDLLKWSWLDEESFFHYFSVEALFAFLLRLEMVERWINLDPEKGKVLFRQLIDSLKGEAEVPAEFK